MIFRIHSFFRLIRNYLLKIKYYKILHFIGPIWRVNIRSGFEITQFNFRNYSPPTRHFTIEIEEGVTIEKDVWLKGTGHLLIGSNTLIGRRTVIGCNQRIKIGQDVLIAENCSIRDTDHNFSDTDIPTREQGILTAPIIINDNVWLGYGVVITKGVTIGAGSVVGANSVVSRSIPANCIAAGVPAKVIRKKEINE